MMKSFIAALFLSAALTGTASAATKTFTSADLFSSKSALLQTEDFSGLIPDTLVGKPLKFKGVTASVNTSVGFPFNRLRSGGALNREGLEGNNLHIGLLEGKQFTISFDTAVHSFGAMFAGVNNGEGGDLRSTFTVRYADGTERLFTGMNGWLSQTDNMAARFFGIVSTSAFSSVTITGLKRSEGFGMDDMRWASGPPVTPVPVPASGLLLMGAMVVAGLFGRRRARR